MLNFLITLGGISLVMSAVIILMLALQKPIKKSFAALGRYIIWSVIIIRLCLPVSLDILPKLITLPTDIPETETVIPEKEVYEPVMPEVIPEVVTPNEPSSEVINEPVFDNTEKEIHTPSSPTAEPAPEKPAFEITGEHIIIALFAVWVVGAVTFVTVTLVRYRINARKLDAALSIPTPELWSIYNTVCRDLGIKKAPPLYIGRADVSPMVYGFFNPKVILPSVEMSAESLTYILRHELTHYKRGDLYFKLIAMLANALHWFNPLAYIACGMMSSEAELSCDESALRKTDLTGRLDYGNSILEIVKLCKHSPDLTTGFSPKKRAVKERFENMINTDKKKKGYWIAALTVVCAILCTSIIGCATEEKEPNDTLEILEPYAEFDAAGDCYDMDGEPLKGWGILAKDGIISIGRPTEDGSVDILYSYGESSKHDGVTDITADYEDPDIEYRYPVFEAWISDNYSIITYSRLPKGAEECANQYIFMIDMSTGEVVHELYYDVGDILKLHGLDRDVLSVYESWSSEPVEYNITVRLSNFDIEGEAPTSLVLIDHQLENKDMRRANIETFFDMETGELSEVKKGHCDLIKYTSGDVITDIADIDNIEGIEGKTAEAVKAFITHDTAALERLGGYEPGSLESLGTISFGDYRISRIGNNTLKIDAKITNGGSAFNIDKGIHTFTAYTSELNAEAEAIKASSTHLTHECVECLVPELGSYNIHAEEMAEGWITFSNAALAPMGDAYNEEYFIDVVRYLHYVYNVNTVAEYRDYAKKCFGIDILNETYTDKEAEDKEAELWEIYCDDSYTKTHYVLHNTVDAGEDYVTMQFYADLGYLIPAYKVKYEFTSEGDELFFKSCTVLDDTGREAHGAKHIHAEYEAEAVEVERDDEIILGQ